jgi:positive regulator of sigma E activity
MTEQLPCVARADADGEGPPKRTRRPALSCIECRMRKVKCDRKEPCGACIRIKSEKCTYRPTRPGIRRSTERSQSTLGDNNAPSPAQSSSQSSLPTEKTFLRLSSRADTGASELVAVLLRENERLRSAVNQGVSHEGDIRPISDIISDLPGTFQKSKFFGQSHWMNAMEPVSDLSGININSRPAC